MISYQWAYQAVARQIHQILEAQGYEVWRDEQDMKDNIVEAMASAIGKSGYVLVLVSRTYKESANCSMECQFAHKNKRKLIPVLVEHGYDFSSDGWLGLLLGTKLYYDVSKTSGAELEVIVKQLISKEVEGSSEAAVPVTVIKKSVLQNEQELRVWLCCVNGGNDTLADKLVKEGLTSGEDLQGLANQPPSELKNLIGLNAKEALVLMAALKELFKYNSLL